MIILLNISLNKCCCSCAVALGLAMARLASAQTTYTTIPADQWGTMQVVLAGSSGGSAMAGLYYPFTGPATKPLSITCQFQPSSYSPDSYYAGYVSPGYISLDMGDGPTDGTVIFEIDKPYSAPWSQAYTEVLLGNVGRGVNLGTYAPGGLYTIKFTFNRVASTIQIDVTGPTSCNRTVSSNGRDIVRLAFHGPNDTALGSSSFGNVSVEAPTPPAAPPALACCGLQMLGGTNVVSLTWTNNGAACVLESSDALTGGWSTVSTSCFTNGNWVGIQVTNNSSAQFFRLRGL
jgi:hypothetical protein